MNNNNNNNNNNKKLDTVLTGSILQIDGFTNDTTGFRIISLRYNNTENK